MKPSLALLIGAALWPWRPAAAAALCGRVEVFGRPLPAGFVTLASDLRPWPKSRPGATERSLVRLRDGRFCLENISTGDYLLQVSPLNFSEPMELRFQGLPMDLGAYRMAVSASGTGIYDGAGRTLWEGRTLELRAPDPEPGPDMEAALTVPDGAVGPMLVAAYLWQGSEKKHSYRFQWLEGGGPFRLRVGAGRLLKVGFNGRGAALYSAFWSDEDGRSTRLRIEAERAGTLKGSVRRADGSAYRPYAGSRVQEHDLLHVSLMGLTRLWGQSIPVDEDGLFEWDVAASGHYVDVLGRGQSAAVGAGPVPLKWVGPGETMAMSFSLRGLDAGLRVPGGKSGNQAQGYRGGPGGRSRMLVGYKSGGLGGEGISVCAQDAQDIFMVRNAFGQWAPQRAERAGLAEELVPARVEAGRYDLYWLETRDLPLPFTRVVSSRSGIELKAGTIAELSGEPTSYPAGKAIVNGTLSGSRLGTLDSIRAARNFEESCTAILPRLNLYDRKGRFVASASAGLSQEGVAAVFEAANRGDALAVDARLNGKRRPFQFNGLAPGRYTAKVRTALYPERVIPLEVSGEGPVALEVDLDRP